MARKVFYFLTLMVGLLAQCYAEDYKRTVITDPSISRRCEVLTETRTEKIANKQRILSLIERNKHLQKITPINKITVKRKLEVNLGRLEHELSLTQAQIQFQEENIVRKGCPGISL